jgi:hypothetical protein
MRTIVFRTQAERIKLANSVLEIGRDKVFQRQVRTWMHKRLSHPAWFSFSRQWGDMLCFATEEDAALFKLKWL